MFCSCSLVMLANFLATVLLLLFSLLDYVVLMCADLFFCFFFSCRVLAFEGIGSESSATLNRRMNEKCLWNELIYRLFRMFARFFFVCRWPVAAAPLLLRLMFCICALRLFFLSIQFRHNINSFIRHTRFHSILYSNSFSPVFIAAAYVLFGC